MSEAPTKAQDIAASIASLPSEVVDGGEVVILAIKPSMWRPLVESSGWIICACLVALTVGVARVSLPGFSIVLTAQLAMLVGLARLGAAIITWIPSWYVLTNRRLITVGGIRSPQISSSLLRDVSRTGVRYSPFERVVGLGTVTCAMRSEAALFQSWQYVASPEVVREQIVRAIDSQAGSW